MAVRQWVNKNVPGSTQAYEVTRMVRKSLPTRKKVQSILATGRPIRLDIGAGDLNRPGWITLDITDNCDLFWDLRKGIPFPDDSVDIVYSSHLFEHMDYGSGQRLMAEVLRVLKPGGDISICVPNARIYIDAYVNGTPLPEDHDFWEPALISREGLDLVNYVAYMGGAHLCMFDEPSLLARLERAGFTDARIRSFDPSIDLPEREFESIYAEARKPA